MWVLTEEDTGPLVAVNTDGDDDIVVSTSPVVILEEEEESMDLSSELEAKVEAGTASKRLERRMKRKSDREAKEIFDNLTRNLPPLPLSNVNSTNQESNPEVSKPNQVTAEEKTLPEIQNLPPPPLPGQLPLPPSPVELGLPPIPTPQREVVCDSCGSSLTVKDMTLRRMTCPICSETIEM